MHGPRTLMALVRNVYRVTRAGQLRFRLETFGLYYPALPYEAPWWRISPKLLLQLVRRLGPYAAWLADMEDIQRGNPNGLSFQTGDEV